MPSTQLSLARTRLQTIAETVSGLAGNCFIVPTAADAEIQAFQRLAPGAFTFLAICESTASFGAVSTPTAIDAYLYMRASPTGLELDDLVATLKTAWETTLHYPEGELVCGSAAYEPYQSLIPEPGNEVVKIKFVCYFPAI